LLASEIRETTRQGPKVIKVEGGKKEAEKEAIIHDVTTFKVARVIEMFSRGS